MWGKWTGKLMELKKPNYELAFKRVETLDSIMDFKELWRRTAISNTLLDKIAFWRKEEQRQTEHWPPYIGMKDSEIQTLESKLLQFMFAYSPKRLKVPPRESFWTSGEESKTWNEAFEVQWRDYLLWCEHNVPLWGTPEFVEPGDQLRDPQGKKLWSPKKDEHGNKMPLINTFPDYGLMDHEDIQTAWYTRIPNFWTTVGSWYWGTDFWTWLGGMVKEIFAKVIQALIDLAKFVLKTVGDALGLDWTTVLFLLIGGTAAFFVGGGLLNEVGQRIAS